MFVGVGQVNVLAFCWSCFLRALSLWVTFLVLLALSLSLSLSLFLFLFLSLSLSLSLSVPRHMYTRVLLLLLSHRLWGTESVVGIGVYICLILSQMAVVNDCHLRPYLPDS